MEPKTISEKMMYSTVRIVANDGSCGTGFFYTFNIEGKIYPTIVTNKHVVNYNKHEKVTFLLHLKDENGTVLDKNIKIMYENEWIFHPSKDLCFTFINPLINEVKSRTGKDVFYISIDSELIYNKEKLETLSALESVVMVGYPTGLWDESNNLPLFRTGYTSNHPAIDFNQLGIGVVDMACFPGSSGSPIFVLNENGYTSRDGNTYLGGKRIIFLGVLFAGPTINLNGEVKIVEIPTKQSVVSEIKSMINLGYYIKAYELFEFEGMIKTIS